MRVLVPIDQSEQSTEAFQTAVNDYPDAEFHLVHVIDFVEAGYATPPGGTWADHLEEWYEAAEEEAEKLFEGTLEQVDADVDVETQTEVGPPARTIVEYADEHDIDRIAIGSHGRSGVSRILLGSVAEDVVRRAPVPVLVVR